MPQILVMLAALAFVALALARRSKGWFAHLGGWQKLIGLIAVLLAILIVMNPETLCLGLLGDTAFFDVLVLLLSIQMLDYVQFAWRHARTGAMKALRWFGIPSPSLRYYVAFSTIAVAGAISALQKLAQRLSP